MALRFNVKVWVVTGDDGIFQVVWDRFNFDAVRDSGLLDPQDPDFFMGVLGEHGMRAFRFDQSLQHLQKFNHFLLGFGLALKKRGSQMTAPCTPNGLALTRAHR